MKKLVYLLFLTGFCCSSYSQQQIITICSEKTGCEFAKVNLSKAQIDNILDKPSFLVKEKEAVIVNLIGCQSSIEKNSTPQSLHQKFGGKGNVVEAKNFDLRNYLIKNACLKSCNSPSIANAGSQSNVKIGLTGNFSFNMKFTFSVKSSEGNVNSYFYLNNQNGYSLMDNAAMIKMANESNYDGEMNQIMTSTSDFYQFTKSPVVGNTSMKLGSKNNNLLTSTQQMSKDFFNKFKKTGAKKRIYGNFDSEEYNGIDEEGNESSIWLSCSGSISLDKKVTYAITGFFGLGYVANPAGETFLVTAIEATDAQIMLVNIENQNISFSGKNYKPMGIMTGQAMSHNKTEMDEVLTQMYADANAEKNPQIKKLILKGIEDYKKMVKNATEIGSNFSQSSDINDIFASSANEENSTTSYFDIMIVSLDQAIAEHEAVLKEARENNDRNNIKRYSCLITCVKAEKEKQEKVRQEYTNILKQFKNDDEIRDEKIDQLFANQGQMEPCNCD